MVVFCWSYRYNVPMALVEIEAIRQAKIAELALRMPVTGNSAAYLLPYYEMRFVQDATGERILDVCAGGSDLTAALLSMGADAYALDFGYYDKHTHKKILSEGNRPPNLIFLTSLDEHPQRYIGASATDLPFPDGSFDRVMSFYGIFGVMDEETDLLNESMIEALRVLKKGGKLQVGPLLEGHISDVGKENQRALIEALKERGDLIVYAGYTLYPVEPSLDYRQLRKLVIKKKTVMI